MSPERFEHLLSLVGPIIQKKDTQLRESISAEQRLVIAIRFLSSCDAQQSLSTPFVLANQQFRELYLRHVPQFTTN